MVSAPFTEEEQRKGHDFLALVGNVFATWQGIEHTVLDIYLAFFKPHRTDASAVVFYSTRTFDARLTLVDGLIAHFCVDAQKEQWAKLHKKIRNKGMARNAIAHGTVTRYGTDSKREWMIGPSPYDLTRNPDPLSKEAYYPASELKSMCESFLRLTKTLDEFRAELEKDKGLHAKLRMPLGRIARTEAGFPVIAQTVPEP